MVYNKKIQGELIGYGDNMDEQTKQWILQAQQGNEEAFTSLYQKYYSAAYRKARSVCMNDADAKDAVQESFYEVHRSLKNLRDPESFYSWLLMIVYSKSNLQYRKYKHITYGEEQTTFSNQEENRIYMNPNKIIEDQSERDILLSLIDSLTTKQAEIIKLVYLQEMKLSEAAKVLNIPLGTVKTRAVRARDELKKKIEEYEKREHRKLSFNVDTLLPLSTFSIGTILLSQIKQKSIQSIQLVSQNAVVSGCVASLSVLAVTGGVFAYDDYKQAQEAQKVAEPQLTQPVEQPPIQKASFSTVEYDEEPITNVKDAFYTCINFAKDEETMKKRTKEEVEEMIPVYEKLKKSGSPYYEQLEKQGWVLWFESILNEQIN